MKEKELLCSHCIYGQLIELVKDEKHIPAFSKYRCVDKTRFKKKKESPLLRFIDTTSGDVIHTQNMPTMLEYEEGPGGWNGKECANFINNQPTKVCQFYAVGKSDNQLLAYDEYDSWGSGRYFTDDVCMCDRYTMSEAIEVSKKDKLQIFLVTITKSEKDRKIEIVEF